MNGFRIERSTIDSSINFVKPFKKGILECRYVSRETNQIIAYLSSQSGCGMSCRMCHLTQTRQTSRENVSIPDYVIQLQTILAHTRNVNETTKLNINFMARGEPLDNIELIEHWQLLKNSLLGIAISYNFEPENVKFNVSTIIPKTNKTAVEIFGNDDQTFLYWSLYSTSEKFRKKWLPKASSIEESLKFLKGAENVILHMAFIKGENDTDEELDGVSKLIDKHFPTSKFNIVRYNPFSPKQGEESDRLEFIAEKFNGTQIVPRVGFDVHASCGMFVEK